MSRPVLRVALFVVCGTLLAAAGWSAIASCTPGVTLRLAVPGLVLLFGLAVERWRYKPVTESHPGGGWVPTNERFVDPESGKFGHRVLSTCDGRARYIAGDRFEPVCPIVIPSGPLDEGALSLGRPVVAAL